MVDVVQADVASEMGKILDAGADAMHGELLSYVFFAGEFAEELIQLGKTDAQRWIDEHPADLGSSTHYPTGPNHKPQRTRPQPPAASAHPPGIGLQPLDESELIERGPRGGDALVEALKPPVLARFAWFAANLASTQPSTLTWTIHDRRLVIIGKRGETSFEEELLLTR